MFTRNNCITLIALYIFYNQNKKKNTLTIINVHEDKKSDDCIAWFPSRKRMVKIFSVFSDLSIKKSVTYELLILEKKKLTTEGLRFCTRFCINKTNELN